MQTRSTLSLSLPDSSNTGGTRPPRQPPIGTRPSSSSLCPQWPSRPRSLSARTSNDSSSKMDPKASEYIPMGQTAPRPRSAEPPNTTRWSPWGHSSPTGSSSVFGPTQDDPIKLAKGIARTWGRKMSSETLDIKDFNWLSTLFSAFSEGCHNKGEKLVDNLAEELRRTGAPALLTLKQIATLATATAMTVDPDFDPIPGRSIAYLASKITDLEKSIQQQMENEKARENWRQAHTDAWKRIIDADAECKKTRSELEELQGRYDALMMKIAEVESAQQTTVDQHTDGEGPGESTEACSINSQVADADQTSPGSSDEAAVWSAHLRSLLLQ